MVNLIHNLIGGYAHELHVSKKITRPESSRSGARVCSGIERPVPDATTSINTGRSARIDGAVPGDKRPLAFAPEVGSRPCRIL